MSSEFFLNVGCLATKPISGYVVGATSSRAHSWKFDDDPTPRVLGSQTHAMDLRANDCMSAAQPYVAKHTFLQRWVRRPGSACPLLEFRERSDNRATSQPSCQAAKVFRAAPMYEACACTSPFVRTTARDNSRKALLTSCAMAAVVAAMGSPPPERCNSHGLRR